MEEKNRSNALAMGFTNTSAWIGGLAACYIAVLPMSSTIALRNIVLLLLVISVTWQLFKIRPRIRLALPLLIWGGYLLLFPLISTDIHVAVSSLEGQWGRGLLVMLAGAATAYILRNEKYGATFHLGLASSFTLLIFLGFFISKAWATYSIPWGYWGRETHHADLGYAAGQAVVLLAATIVSGQKKYQLWSWVLIVVALVSTALAHSRAGLAFAILGGALVFLIAFLMHASKKRLYVIAGMVTLLLASSLVLGVAIKQDTRWGGMTDKLAAGFMGNPLQIECEGTASVEGEIISQHGPGEKAESVIASVRDGDGSRMVILRAGLELALKHPWGIDGSRQAFQKRLKEECGAEPVLKMAHAHNGWIDTVLAIGWIGALLYLWVFLYFSIQGYKHLRQSSNLNEWALVLVALSIFWMLRAFGDSVFRDHMFEMQGFVLAYALVSMRCRTIKEK